MCVIHLSLNQRLFGINVMQKLVITMRVGTVLAPQVGLYLASNKI
jgi:hypothetical protein